MRRHAAPWGLLFVVPLALSCGRFGKSDPSARPPAHIVVVDRALRQDAVDRVEVLGDVHGEQEVRVFAQVPERIRVLHVQDGDRVRAGDPIVTLSADLFVSGVHQANAALTAAESARDQLRADRARLHGLVEQGAVPRSQLEGLEAQLRTSEAQVDQLSAARRTAGEQRDRTVVRAPIDGTVALLTVQQGDMVAPTLPVCAIVQSERVIVRLRVTEQDYVRLRPGMSAAIDPPALPDVSRRGIVQRVSPVLDPLTRTATVEVQVPNPDGVLRPGMVARASIELSRRTGIVLAPARALVLSSRTDTERAAAVFVYERARSIVRRRNVRLGRHYGQRIEIERGLRGGEEIVVQGQHLLRSGARVRTTSSPPPVARANETRR